MWSSTNLSRRRFLCLLFLSFASQDVFARDSIQRYNSHSRMTFAPKPHRQIEEKELVSSIPTTPSISKETSCTSTSFPPSSFRGGAFGGGMFTSQNLQGVLSFILFDILLRKFFVSQQIAFPSMLAGCVGLFALLVVMEIFGKGMGESLFAFLNPGAVLLAKWLPIFFVPGLAMLPLAPNIGSPFEVVKVLSVVIIGWFFTLFSTGYSVLSLRSLQGKVQATPVVAPASPKKSSSASPPAPAPKVFPDEVYHPIVKGSILFGILSIVLTNMDVKSSVTVPIQTLFMACTTISSYIFGTRLDKSITAIIHPLVTSTAVTLLVTNLSGKFTGKSFVDVLKTYKAGSLSFTKGGAGDFLLFLLGPSVISMCTAMYSRKTLMKDNLAVVLASMFISAGGGLFATAAFVRILQIASSIIRISVLPRNVTTALAMAISQMMEGDIGITASVVVMTGIIGATFGIRVLTSIGIMDPVARGLAIGSSSQGLGVASMLQEKDSFPFAAIGMVLTAIGATTLVSITPIRELLLKIALGN